MKSQIENLIQASIDVKHKLLSDPFLLTTIENIVDEIIESLNNGGKILFCGNGGSAADAQHIAAELSGRFYTVRKPLYAEALHVNSSYITAVANDYSYDVVYSRMIEGCGKKGDVLVGISTSGNSKNVIEALKKANEKEMITVSMTGETGGKMKELSKYILNVPSTDTPRIQESHILLGHIICQLVEEKMFG
jgi:D-sedoheptulose 7-phosphate isomerase